MNTKQRKVSQMAFQTARPVKKAAPGDAKNTGAPGPTPAPVKFANPSLNERQFTPGYGTNHFTGASSVTPGGKVTSPLADDLKSKAAEGDAGDLLQAIVEGGTARGKASRVELQAPQTRDIDNTSLPITPGMRSRNGEGDKVPATCGAPAFDPTQIRKP
jgi:hypothetical protein